MRELGMDRRSIFKNLLALILPIASIAVAFLLDRGFDAWRKEVSRTLQFTNLIPISMILADLVIVLSFLLIGWIILVRGYGSKMIAAVYLVFGAFVLFMPLSTFLLDFGKPLFSIFMHPPLLGIRFVLMDVGFRSWTSISSVFVVVIGIIQLVMKTNPKVG